MKATRCVLIGVSVISFSLLALAQGVTNDVVQGTHPKTRPLTESEAREVRSRGIDPKGMVIDADPPIWRFLTAQELQNLENQGVDSAGYKGKSVEITTDAERAALEKLIQNAPQTNSVTESKDFKGAIIWMDNFMGTTNATIIADVINAKPESLRFKLDGAIYDYSGHYTIILEKPRKHAKPFLGLGNEATAKLVILENFHGTSLPLTNVVIWDKKSGYINLVETDTEWIYSGTYTIQP